MRYVIMSLTLLAAFPAVTSGSAQAAEQADRFCLKADAGTGCAFRTYSQCMEARQGEGGYCYLKPVGGPRPGTE